VKFFFEEEFTNAIPETMPKRTFQADFALIGLFDENIIANNGGK
jgi:hypothetical protein